MKNGVNIVTAILAASGLMGEIPRRKPVKNPFKSVHDWDAIERAQAKRERKINNRKKIT